MICPHCSKPIKHVKKDDTVLFGQVMKLRAEGYSVRDIEKLTGVSYPTVSRWTTTKRKARGK